MSNGLSLSSLSIALLRAAAEGRLHREGLVYRWHPRTNVRRALATPGIAETCVHLRDSGLINNREDDTAVALTERGREALADYHGGVRRAQ